MILFLSQLFVILLNVFIWFGEFIYQKIEMNQMLGWDFYVMQQDTF